MPTQRPSLNKLILQAQLNKFYSHPIARVSLGLILTILTLVFFALVAIRPTLQTMAELIRTIDDKKIIDQKLSLKIAALSSAQAELATKAEAANILDVAVPSTPTFSLLLKEVEKLISEHDVTLISLIAQSVPIERDPTTVATTDLQSIPLTITLNGSYTNLLETLRQMYSLQRILVIDRVDMLPPSDQDTETLNMSVAARAFAFGIDTTKSKTAGKK